MRYLTVRCLAVLLLAAAASASELENQLQSLAAEHRGRVAVYARHLNTGASVAVHADVPVQTASVIKLPIMVEVYAQVRAGKLRLGDKVVLRKDDQVPGSGILSYLRPGLELTLEDAVVLMMTLSDNTATNLVIDKVSIAAVNQRLKKMGLKDTWLYKKVYKPAEGPQPEDQKRFGLGKTTAREMGRVLESILACDLGEKAVCARMLEIMRGQQYRNMLPRYLETVDTSEVTSRVASKLGMLDKVRNDVGVVETATGPIVISIFTWENEDQRWTAENDAELLVARMAKLIVDAWTPRRIQTRVPSAGTTAGP